MKRKAFVRILSMFMAVLFLMQSAPAMAAETSAAWKSKKPTIKTVQNLTDSGMTVSWKKVKGAAGYQIQYAEKSDFSDAKTVKAGKSATSITIQDLKPKTKYYVRIRAHKNISGKKTYTAWSKKKSCTISFYAPTLTKVTAGEEKAVAKWKKVSGADGYQLQYSTKKSFSKAKKVTIKKAATVKKTIKKLAGGEKYYFRLRAYKTVDGKKNYTAWSKTVAKKIKSKEKEGQALYDAYLEQLKAEDEKLAGITPMIDKPVQYGLYDIDRNGTPELITLVQGEFIGQEKYSFYTCTSGQVELLSQLGYANFTSLNIDDATGDLVGLYYRMNYASYMQITMENGAINITTVNTMEETGGIPEEWLEGKTKLEMEDYTQDTDMSGSLLYRELIG